jgi:hypothetical protein
VLLLHLPLQKSNCVVCLEDMLMDVAMLLIAPPFPSPLRAPPPSPCCRPLRWAW